MVIVKFNVCTLPISNMAAAPEGDCVDVRIRPAWAKSFQQPMTVRRHRAKSLAGEIFII